MTMELCMIGAILIGAGYSLGMMHARAMMEPLRREMMRGRDGA